MLGATRFPGRRFFVLKHLLSKLGISPVVIARLQHVAVAISILRTYRDCFAFPKGRLRHARNDKEHNPLHKNGLCSAREICQIPYRWFSKKRVAASKPQALGMVENLNLRPKRQKNNVLIFDDSSIIIGDFNTGPRRRLISGAKNG